MKEYVCVDVETTGLDPTQHEIIEVVAVLFLDNGKITNKFYQRCRPKSGAIPAGATEVHGIKYEDVKNEPNYFEDGVREKLAEFIGKRTVIGHNIATFDLGFLKIEPVEIIDTLQECRKKYKSGNKLELACKRAGVEFDKSQGHSAEYDCVKTIELFWKLLPELLQKEESGQTTISFKPEHTQSYSYSRLNTYHTCPYKWYKIYIDRITEPPRPYLQTGSVCHKIAEKAGVWCYRELFTSKFTTAFNKGFLKDDVKIRLFNASETNDPKLAAKFLFDNQVMIEEIYGGGLAKLLFDLEQFSATNDIEIEMISIPDLESYNKIIQESLAECGVTDPVIAKDVNSIMSKFYKTRDYSLASGEIALFEKKLAFKRDWSLCDWQSPEVFFRGVLDVIEYYPGKVTVKDYKSSRIVPNVKYLKDDIQMKIYGLLISKYLPVDSFNNLTLQLDYIRYSTPLVYEVPDVKQFVKEAEVWLDSTISEIELKLTKGIDEFKPRRNEYCHSCHIAEEGMCKLFNRKYINNINDIEKFEVKTIEDCATAWKRIEINKTEIKNLTSKCKKFVKSCEDPIYIDNNAVLNFYQEESRNFDSVKTFKLLLSKNIDIKTIVKYINVSESNFNDLIDATKATLSEDELNSISEKTISNKFDARIPGSEKVPF